MDKTIRIAAIAIASLIFSMHVFAEESASKKDRLDADILIKAGLPHIEFISYAGLGSGATWADTQATPLLESNLGFQLWPSLAIGAFYTASPLSDLKHAAFGLSIANTEAAYMLQSGTEILFTPLADHIIHPLIRATLGGATVGYLKDTDGEEGCETSVQNRYFQASISAGAELNSFTPY
ncbi:hypothetical protein MASR2M78_10850 [Treponema sp.]